MQAVIIAAGESSRFWPLNTVHKSASSLLGKPLVYWTVKGFVDNNIKDIAVVCSKGSAVPELLKQENDLGASLQFFTQQEPIGTGNALLQAKSFVKGEFFVSWPNKVISKSLAKKMMEQKAKDKAQVVLAGAETKTPWDYGVARLEGKRVVEIVENPEQGKEPSNFKVTGFYLFEPDFFEYYEKLPQHHEADSIETINNYLKDKTGSLVTLEEDVPALKYPWELFLMQDILFRSENFKPSIHKTATIEKNVVLKGDVMIGENTVVKANTVIEGPCFIGANCEIGYNNVLRGPLDIERNVKTGSFCEIKHSVIQEGTHLHSGYLGDSLVGKNCRIGAGFVAANRRFDRKNIFVVVKGKKVDSGFTHLGTAIGDNTRIGIQSGTMPGVLIGPGCAVKPGTMLFENLIQ